MFLAKKESGWFCLSCRQLINGRRDAETHLVVEHQVPEENLKFDDRGNVYDSRESWLERLRGGGAI
jgi:hypothetical protein